MNINLEQIENSEVRGRSSWILLKSTEKESEKNNSKKVRKRREVRKDQISQKVSEG